MKCKTKSNTAIPNAKGIGAKKIQTNNVQRAWSSACLYPLREVRSALSPEVSLLCNIRSATACLTTSKKRT